jgi:hypothetical protein
MQVQGFKMNSGVNFLLDKNSINFERLLIIFHELSELKSSINIISQEDAKGLTIAKIFIIKFSNVNSASKMGITTEILNFCIISRYIISHYK